MRLATGLPRPFAHDDAGDTRRRGRERQQARKEQHHQRAGEQADRESGDKPQSCRLRSRARRRAPKIAAGALEVGRLPLELLRGGAYQGLAAALGRRIVRRALPENRRLLYAVHPLRNSVERLHELGELGLVVLRRLDLFELVESRFQPTPHHGHFRADLRALRLDRAPERIERGGRVAGVLVQCLPCDSLPCRRPAPSYSPCLPSQTDALICRLRDISSCS